MQACASGWEGVIAKRADAPKREAARAGRNDAALDPSPLGAGADDDLPF